MQTLIQTPLLSFSALLLVPPATLHAAEFKLVAVFSDHIVLRPDGPVPVWRWGMLLLKNDPKSLTRQKE